MILRAVLLRYQETFFPLNCFFKIECTAHLHTTYPTSRKIFPAHVYLTNEQHFLAVDGQYEQIWMCDKFSEKRKFPQIHDLLILDRNSL
jgi:hypothetical protein